jgi:hypothetical protein
MEAAPVASPPGPAFATLFDECFETMRRLAYLLGADVPPGGSMNDPARHPDSPGCGPVRWPDPPNGGPPSTLWTRAVFPAAEAPWPTGPLPGLLLFSTVPAVATLEVGDAHGFPVRVTELARLDDTALFLADFGPSTWAGYRFTAKDAAGNVLASGII